MGAPETRLLVRRGGRIAPARAVAEFNARFRRGDRVRLRPYPGAPAVEDRVFWEAEVYEGAAVAWLAGQVGPVPADCVEAL